MMEKEIKIKRDILIGLYKKGGYKMIEIQTQNKALKMTWIH